MSRLRRSRVAPLALWLMATAAAPLSQDIAGAAASKLWFVPWQRRRAEPTAAALLGTARRLRLGDAEVVVHEHGEGPAVLLVHGWAMHAAVMSPFVEPLVAAGYRTVAVDLPAHGASPGNVTDGPAMARVVEELLRRFDAQAVIAHSLGALATTHALSRAPGLPVRRVALLAPLPRIDEAIGTFAREVRLPARAVAGLRRVMERRFSPSVWSDFAADHNLRDSTINGLIVHDVDDRRVPIDSVRRLQRAWRRSRLLETRGLGHNRILRAPEVVSAVVAHVTGRLAAASSA